MAEAKSSTRRRGAASDEVTIELAHPLDAIYGERLGLDEAGEGKDRAVGEKVKLRRDQAVAVINAGYAAGIEPENAEQVADALGEPAPATTSGAKSNK